MRMLCAPDSFKDSLSAVDAAEAMAAGVRRALAGLADCEPDICPISDGGEGFTHVLAAANDAALRTVRVTGPRGGSVEAPMALFGEGDARTAAIELASASGLELLAEAERDPMRTTTFGTGELIRAALDAGAKRILLGIGGSATTDGGCGAAQALGVRFLTAAGCAVADAPITGGQLRQIQRIDTSGLDPRLREADLLIACDVTNPMTGPNGAAHIYAPQKGATPDQVESLDAGLSYLAERFRRDLDVDVEQAPGSGAAGAFGGGAMAMLGGKLERGIELVLQATGFEQRLAACELCLTGEGKLDGQTASGKAVMGVIEAAARHDVPVFALAGCIGEDVQRLVDAGLSGYELIGPGLSRDESIRRAAKLIEAAAERVVQTRLANGPQPRQVEEGAS